MRAPLLAIFLLLAAAPAPAQDQAELFEDVVDVLSRRFHDKEFRKEVLPGIAERYREQARAAQTPEQRKLVVHDFLSNVPASHLAIYSQAAQESMTAELMNQESEMFGFQLVDYDGRYFIERVLEGSPAESAGLKRGDRVLSIDGDTPADSPRLDWRTDDAYLPDPPLHSVKGEDGERIVLEVERQPGHTLSLRIESVFYSSWEAAKASVRVFKKGEHRFGYVHFWYFHVYGMPQMFERLATKTFADCDAIILDMRGRGGSAGAVQALLAKLSGKNAVWDKPVITLIDDGSRSAKEVFAWEFRERGIGKIVGETTAGAVIPATFTPVGDEMVLMFPSFKLPKYTNILEGKGVEPDVRVRDDIPYAAGADPILEVGIRTLAADLEAMAR